MIFDDFKKPLGTYRYSYAVARYPVLQLSRFSLRVEVLEEKNGRYKVRFMEYHADQRPPNTVTWVKATSVKLDEGVQDKPQRAVSWLPYKDD